MVTDTDDEEERKLLLSESVTSSPVKASREDPGIRRHLLEESLGPKRGLLESLTPRLAWTSSSMGDNDKEWRQYCVSYHVKIDNGYHSNKAAASQL